MPLKYHYSKHEDLDKVLDAKLGIEHKPLRYTLKTTSKSQARRSRNSLFFDYSIVIKSNDLHEIQEEAIFQSQLSPRTDFILEDSKQGIIGYYRAGKLIAKTPEERLLQAIFKENV